MPNDPKQNGEPKLSDKEQAEADRLLDKSQEAFILAVELFNRPTIRYRAEGCAFFLCNAWELMLKAYLMKRDGRESLFYKDNPNRSIALIECLGRVMTNKNDPVRRNIEVIEHLRNQSTHFIVPEYEITYGPLFQASIHNYDAAMSSYHGINVSDQFPDNYLILTVNRTAPDPRTIHAKYTPEIAEQLLNETQVIQDEEQDENNKKFSEGYETTFTISKKNGIPIKIDKNATSKANIIKRVINPADRYPYTTAQCIREICNRLGGHDKLLHNGGRKQFNKWHFGLFVKCYAMKEDRQFAYDLHYGQSDISHYLYAQRTVDFIVDEVHKDPDHIVDKLLNEIRRKKQEKA